MVVLCGELRSKFGMTAGECYLFRLGWDNLFMTRVLGNQTTQDMETRGIINLLAF